MPVAVVHARAHDSLIERCSRIMSLGPFPGWRAIGLVKACLGGGRLVQKNYFVSGEAQFRYSVHELSLYLVKRCLLSLKMRSEVVFDWRSGSPASREIYRKRE